MLTVETTHVKMGWIQATGGVERSGDDEPSHFVRHGDFLTVNQCRGRSRCISKSRSFEAPTTCSISRSNSNRFTAKSSTKIAGRPDGYVPHHLPGTTIS